MGASDINYKKEENVSRRINLQYLNTSGGCQEAVLSRGVPLRPEVAEQEASRRGQREARVTSTPSANH